ncbi:hypothetical protein D8M04_04415 [Oceanobacillus piezotolerans]|uniref:VCBS repeat-containing protein n=1 Tax=Oceanobacillus piezotolerans TaxID=2448030 RepID=A0A498D798_9BACI|nr:hypothetical protein [Oceanobacillus piezotolerans]RLL46456.1 hypothetical protein D8M04_04415 [Oceanobacillus piezotolerans]
MKYFILVIVFLVVLPNTIYSEETENDTINIDTYQVDITGDGLLESIHLKGRPFSPDADYFHSIWAEIKSPDDELWTIQYGSGYDPEIKFVDINHDKIQDMLYQSPTGGSGGLYHYDLHSLANNELLEIPLPNQEYVSGAFKDNFIIELSLSPNDKSIVMDVSNRAKEYIKLGIYNKRGNLLKSTSVMIDPIAFFEPVTISESKGQGLKSFKQISGGYHADQLGTIEALWYYLDGEWIILKKQWNETTP